MTDIREYFNFEAYQHGVLQFVDAQYQIKQTLDFQRLKVLPAVVDFFLQRKTQGLDPLLHLSSYASAKFLQRWQAFVCAEPSSSQELSACIEFATESAEIFWHGATYPLYAALVDQKLPWEQVLSEKNLRHIYEREMMDFNECRIIYSGDIAACACSQTGRYIAYTFKDWQLHALYWDKETKLFKDLPEIQNC